MSHSVVSVILGAILLLIVVAVAAVVAVFVMLATGFTPDDILTGTKHGRL